ncbi:MAG: thiamine pyrophosphate-binding protein [Chloroflexi bacterium]|nr:thiamine pyrophosphate-binding protein [Chloroflexota bacterium]
MDHGDESLGAPGPGPDRGPGDPGDDLELGGDPLIDADAGPTADGAVEPAAEIGPAAEAEPIAAKEPAAGIEPTAGAEDRAAAADLAAEVEPGTLATEDTLAEPAAPAAGTEPVADDAATAAEPAAPAEPDAPAVAGPESTTSTAPPDDADPVAAAEPAAPSAPRPTIAQLVAQRLHEAGARVAFTVPSDGVLPLLGALSDGGIRVVATRHPAAASVMAAATAQLTGRPQVVVVGRTPGAAGAAVGIHVARQDSVPLVAVVGDVRREHRGRGAVGESDLANGIGALASWSVELERPGDAGRVLGEAMRQLASGRPGPILLAIPEDLLAMRLSQDPPPVSAATVPTTDRDAVKRAVKALAASHRGVILAGGGVLRARASKRLVALADELGVPIIAAWRRADVVPADHPAYVGVTGPGSPRVVRRRLEEADVVLVLGARLDEATTNGYRLPTPAQTFIQVGLEPRVAARGLRAPDITITADISRFLDLVAADLRGKVLDAANREQRLAARDADRTAWLAATEPVTLAADAPGVHAAHVSATLQAALPATTIVALDTGAAVGAVAATYRFPRPGTALATTSDALGYAIPAAIAASIVHPDRPTVAVCGDGGFAASMAELETAVREGARPIIIVLDDRAFGAIRAHQDRVGQPRLASELGPIDAAAVGEACGALAFRVTDDAAFEPALREALAARRPAVIWCALEPQAAEPTAAPHAEASSEPE